jgi:hypothetical protein
VPIALLGSAYDLCPAFRRSDAHHPTGLFRAINIRHISVFRRMVRRTSEEGAPRVGLSKNSGLR